MGSASVRQDSAAGRPASTCSSVIALRESSGAICASVTWPICSGRPSVTDSVSASPRRLGSRANAFSRGRASVRSRVSRASDGVSTNSRPLRAKKAPPPGWRTASKCDGCSRRDCASASAAASASSGTGACTTARISRSRSGKAWFSAAS
ncbi:hypothetical protein GCM10009078_28870 [Cupriavidus gilardii]